MSLEYVVERKISKSSKTLNETFIEIVTLPPDVVLYHGTNAKFDDKNSLKYPAWFSDNYNVAHYFSDWKNNSGQRRIIKFHTIRPLKLFSIDSNDKLRELAESVGSWTGDLCDMVTRFIPYALEKKVDGWIAPNTYSKGADILICNNHGLHYNLTENL